GFPPTKAKDRNAWMDRLRSADGLAVFYEAPHRILQTLEEIERTLGDAFVVVARELTKTHEELVRGPISAVLSRGMTPRGEFVIVIDIGQLTEIAGRQVDGHSRIELMVEEFCSMTKNSRQTRRQAISALARKYGLTAKEAYRAVEDAKRSGS